MSAASSLSTKLVVDKKGDPLEVIIPYQQFIDFIEEHGLDLSDEDVEGILQARKDKEEGRATAIVTLEELEKELAAEG